MPKPIAPFDKDPKRSAETCFDRETRKPVPPSHLKTYRQAPAQYHLSPEPKFREVAAKLAKGVATAELENRTEVAAAATNTIRQSSKY